MEDFRLANKVRFNKHKNRKNNDIVAAMYAMYLTGKSLRYIGKTYKKSNQAVHDMFRSRGYELRSKQLRGLQVLDGIKFTLMKGGYLRGSHNGKRILMHHYVWQKEKGEIPKEHCIYHIDRNKENNAVENLAILHLSKMGETFNPKGNNQHTK